MALALLEAWQPWQLSDPPRLDRVSGPRLAQILRGLAILLALRQRPPRHCPAASLMREEIPEALLQGETENRGYLGETLTHGESLAGG